MGKLDSDFLDSTINFDLQAYSDYKQQELAEQAISDQNLLNKYLQVLEVRDRENHAEWLRGMNDEQINTVCSELLKLLKCQDLIKPYQKDLRALFYAAYKQMQTR